MRMQRGLIGLFILIAGGFHGVTFAQTNELEWIGNTLHEPSIPRAGQDIIVQTETLPAGAGENGFALFGVNSNWSAAWLERLIGLGSNDMWRGKIGRFSAGDVVEYLVGVVDGVQTNYDNNGGSNYAFTVTNGEATTWIGDIGHSPTNGALASTSNLWLNLFAAPSQTLVRAFADFSINGTLWESAALEFWQMSGSNEWWHVDLGAFPPSSTVWYAFEAEDGVGTTHVRPTNGLPYFATVAGSETDSDEDGLPDDWEEYWFGALTNATGAGNPDDDGLTDLPMDNQLEFALGTDPDYSNAVEGVRVLWKPSLPLRGGAAKFSVGVGTQEELFAESIAMDLDLGAGGTAQLGLVPEESGRFEGIALLATNASQLHVVRLSSAGGTNDNRGIGWTLPIAEATGDGNGPDADADGMPDAWELAYGLDPFDAADAADDADGDGWSNGDEYVAGRDPQAFYSRPYRAAVYLMNETNWCGTRAIKDDSGLGNHGTTTNGARTATEGAVTYGVFDATNSVRVPNSTNLQITGDLTLSCWINMTNSPLNEHFLSRGDESGEFSLYCTTSRSITFYHGSPLGYEGMLVIPGGLIPQGKWCHLVLTRNSESREIRSYLNGRPVVVTNYTTNVLQHPAAIVTSLVIGKGLNGYLDDVVIESRVWSTNEIGEIYDADNDQLPGLWEEANGLDPADPADALADPDEDGFSTAREYYEGTDAFDGESHPGGVRARYGMNEQSWTGALNEVVDVSGCGNHGQALYGTTTATDAYGTHGMFSGTNYVTVPDSASLRIAGDLTISFWINMVDVPLNGAMIYKRGANGEFAVYCTANRNLTFYHGTPQGYEGFSGLAGSGLAPGKWFHMVVTRNTENREIRSYVNGAPVVVTNYTTNALASTYPLIIGRYLKGGLDDVVIENRVRSAEEVQSNYDEDGDRLPNAWEEVNGLDPQDAADALVDPDGDGFSTVQEFCETTDPFDAVSHPGGVRARYLMDQPIWDGTTNEVADSSGLENHGTAASGTTTATDAYGTHGVFNGTNSVIVPNSTNLQVAGDLTISFWINMTNNPVPGYFISKKGLRGEFGLYFPSATQRHISFYHGGLGGYQGGMVLPGSSIMPGKWYHVAITRAFTNREIRAYLNGVQVCSTNYSDNLLRNPMASAEPVVIGQGLKGSLDELLIENRVWSSQEVAAVYDPDGDHLPRLWEEANAAQGASPTNAADAAADPDGDGFSTYQEYCEGTNPFDVANHPGGVRARYLMNETNWTGAPNEVLDVSGLNNHGTTTNGATTFTDAFGTHGMFDGINSVTVPSSTNLQVTGDLTLSLWINMTNNPEAGYFLIKGGSAGEFGLYSDAGREIRFYHGSPKGGEGFYLVPDGRIAKGKWYHLAVTRSFTNREIRAYLNGAQVCSTNYSENLFKQPMDSESPLILGTKLQGLIDEALIENRAWSSEEVAAIYDPDGDHLPRLWEEANAAQGASPTNAADAVADADEDGFSTYQEYCERTDPFDADSHPGGVRARYLMDETGWTGAAGEVVDASGLGNHGTTTNGATTSTDAYGTHGEFNGTNSVTVPNAESLQLTGDLTLSCWLNMASNPAPAYFLSKGGSRGEFGLYFSGSTRTISFYHGGTEGTEGYAVVPGGYIVLGNWCHLALTRSFANREIQAYLNGVRMFCTNYSADVLRHPWISDSPLIMGMGLFGKMDDVVVENRVWGSNEVAAAFAKTPLVLSCPSNRTIDCDDGILPEQTGEAFLSGGSGVGYEIAYSDESVGSSISGQIYRTWSGRDSLWNTAACMQVITRLDVTVPAVLGVPADETVPCDSIPVSAEVTAADNCDPAVAVEFSETNGVVDGVGTIVRTWTATDSGGNSASATQTIMVVDADPPALACPADATACANATDPQFAGTATATDGCDGSPEVAYSDVETAGAEGVLLAEWNFPGSPDDATADGGTAANATNQIATTGGTGAVGFSQAGTTTRCANATGWNEGNGTKAWRVECSAAGYRNLKVSSKQRGSSTGPRDFRLQCSLDGSTWTDVADVPAVADNFTAGVLAEQALPAALDGQARIYLRWVMRSNVSVGGGTVAGTGNNRIDDVRIVGDEASSGNLILRVWTATDAAGNVASATQTITVAEALPPTLSEVPADETASCDAIPVPPNISASSSCDPAVIVEFSETNGVVDGVGTIVRTWTATDSGGNVASATQTITVVDADPPALACPADATACANATDPQFAGTATATDGCDGSPEVAYSDVETAGAEGVLLAEWNFPGSPDDATADGGTAANATNQIATTGGTGAVGFSQAGASTRCANATGWNEGEGTKAWQVECTAAGYANMKVSSKQRSSSTGPRDFKLQCSLDGSAWTDVADVPAVADNFTAGVLAEQALPAAMDGQARIYLRWVMRSNVSAGGGTVAGTGNNRIDDVRITGDEASSGNLILRVWTATDAAGNVASATQTIAVLDSMPLAISCPPDMAVGCGESIDPTQTGIATATDPCGASNAVAYSDAIASGFTPGIQEVIARTWTATGSAGRMAVCTQTITVVDAVPPAIICPPDVTLACGAPIDPSHTGLATALDACSASNTITYSDDAGNAPGSEAYEVILRTWTATDASGNAAVCTQTISIVRLSIVCPPDVTVECGDPADPSHTGIATVSVACGATNVVVAYSDETSGIQGGGAYEQIARTWTATDGYSNHTSAIQTITVMDTTPPVLVDMPSNAFLRCGDPIPEPGAIGVTDCDTNVDLSYGAVTNGTCPAVITRTWTARDSRGNETNAVQLISIYGPVRNLKNSGASFSTIQETINAAQEGDMIGIRQDVYQLNEPIVLKAGVKLQGGYDENWEMTGGPESTVLDGQNSVRCMNAVDLAEPCEVANLTMRNGEADRGGAVLIINSAVRLRDCVIAQNHATQGGAIYCSKRANIDLVNCLVVQNSANQDAGVSAPLCFGRLRFQNCTFMANADVEGRSATLHVGEWLGSPARFTDSILWNSGAAHELNSYPCTVMEISHCVVQGGAPPGIGNLSADPAFANEVEGDAHLLPASSAIDAGSKSALDTGLDANSGYGTNPDGVQGDKNQLDIGFHYKGY